MKALKPRKSLFVPERDNFSKVPKDMLTTLGELKFQKELDLKHDEKRIALDANEVISNIEEKGYHFQSVTIATT